MKLQTRRLILREFTLEDASLIFEVDQDPEVMRFVDIGRVLTMEDIRIDLLPRILKSYRDIPGLGTFPAFETATGECIGWFHFRPSRDNPQEVDLGYRLHRRFWGRGYATEVSRALIHFGFTELNVSRVVAFALLANTHSIRVMEKTGLSFEKSFIEPGAVFRDKRAVKYSLSRETALEKLVGQVDVVR